MARKRKKDDGTESLVWLLTICTLGIILLIKWVIEFIVWLVKVIANAINNSSKKEEQKGNINNITNTPFSGTTIKGETIRESSKNSNSSGIDGAIVGLALMDELKYDEEDESDEDNVSGYTDDELDNYGLEDWQKDLVKKGEYDPWNFEEEDLEEDDYYYEDD